LLGFGSIFSVLASEGLVITNTALLGTTVYSQHGLSTVIA
jgi:hypothetical protein